MSNKRKPSPQFDEAKRISKSQDLYEVKPMDSLKSSDHISEYKDANERFRKFTNDKNQIDDANQLLDRIVEKLCREGANINCGGNPSLFYELVYYSDFIQIKDEFVDNFYSNLWNNFVLGYFIDDIIRNSRKLEDIPHVKKYIFRGFLRTLPLSATVDSNFLVIAYSKEKLSYQMDLQRVSSVTIRPSAYKVILSNERFNFKHLNFLLQLLDVKHFILRGCNLNVRDVKELFVDLKLEFLDLSECGISINEIISTNILGNLKNLKSLDVSENPLFESTLKKIRCFPLANLNIKGCIKTSGVFMNSIWFHKDFDITYNLEKTKTEKAAVNIDLLWEDGIIKETIEVLNVGQNNLSQDNLRKILKLPLKELDITGSLGIVQFEKLIFPDSLKILKARKNHLHYNAFKVLSGLKLEKLELDYYGGHKDNFTTLMNSPITFTLKELSLGVPHNWWFIIPFISNLKLEAFQCGGHIDICENVDLEMDIEMFINTFISYNPEERKHLKVLNIQGKIRGAFSIDLHELNLLELSLNINNSSKGIHRILSCENLHESVVNLELNEYMVKDQDLIQIAKFKKLQILSFSFSKNISEENLRKIFEMKMLKKLELKAVIDGSVDENMARLLCVAPIKHLKFVSNGKITKGGIELLSKNDNFSKQLVSLEMQHSILDSELVLLLMNAYLESIKLNDCFIDNSTLCRFLANENLIFTLEYLYLYFKNKHDYQVPKSLSGLKLSELEIFNPVSIKSIDILTSAPISKFLMCLTLNTICSKSYKYLRNILKNSLSKVYLI